MPDNTFDEMTFACISFNKKCNNVFFIYNQIDHGVRVFLSWNRVLCRSALVLYINGKPRLQFGHSGKEAKDHLNKKLAHLNWRHWPSWLAYLQCRGEQRVLRFPIQVPVEGLHGMCGEEDPDDHPRHLLQLSGAEEYIQYRAHVQMIT